MLIDIASKRRSESVTVAQLEVEHERYQLPDFFDCDGVVHGRTQSTDRPAIDIQSHSVRNLIVLNANAQYSVSQ